MCLFLRTTVLESSSFYIYPLTIKIYLLIPSQCLRKNVLKYFMNHVSRSLGSWQSAKCIEQGSRLSLHPNKVLMIRRSIRSIVFCSKHGRIIIDQMNLINAMVVMDKCYKRQWLFTTVFCKT